MTENPSTPEPAIPDTTGETGQSGQTPEEIAEDKGPGGDDIVTGNTGR